MNHDLFDWDQANIAHIARHDVTPEEAEQAFFTHSIDVGYHEVDGEERFELLGLTSRGRLLFLAIIERSGKIRVVTAFSATPYQTRAYFLAAGHRNDG